nr:NAD(P)/FAD-dependent oxidoreductase [Tissierella sp.]
MYDVTIIGAGIIGSFIARELSRYDLKILVLEKENDVSNGATKANSAIAHAGYDAEPGSLKARFNVEGNKMFDEICEDLDVPFKRIGSLVVGFNEEDRKTLEKIYKQGIINGVPEMRLIEREELKKMEPNISDEALMALHAATAGIMGPWELAVALMENAMDNGVELSLNREVTHIEKEEEGYKIYTRKGQVRSKYIVNAAGLYADKIHNMVAREKFTIIPRRGQYFLFDKKAGDLVNSVIFQCPTMYGKGVLVLPTTHGNLLVGPNAEVIQKRDNVETTEESLNFIRETSSKAIKNIPFRDVITSFSGIRATPDKKDFIIEEVEGAQGFIDVAGIESPGLSASPAIGKYVAEMLKDMDGGFKENKDFNPKRRPMIKFMELDDDGKKDIIEKDPKYGRIICRCENITEGEIVDSIHRNAGGKTVDGIKRRVRPGSGRCQGGFCQPRVMEILARELEIDLTEVVKDRPGSNIALWRTKD